MTASAFDQLVISTSSSSPLTGDGDGGIAAFKRMLAENEEDRLSSISCEAPTRGESSPTVADINNALRVKAVKPNPHQSNTDRFCLLEPSDYEALRNENEQLSRTIDQLERQLQSRMQAFEEAIREATAYQQKAELRQSQLDTLRAEHQKLKDSAASVTVLVDRNTQLHEENKSNRVQIERLMQERLRLDDDLARKDNKNVQLEQDVLQFTQQLGPLQHQLGRMSTIEEQLGDKVSEIERLKSDLATLTTQKNMQSEELTAARAELQVCRNTDKTHCMEGMAPASSYSDSQSDEDIPLLKEDIAKAIARLDTAHEGCRLFYCNDTKSVGHSGHQKSTRVWDAKDVADSLFRDWKDDEEFMEEYSAERQSIIRHHRLHERKDPGRGDSSTYLKELCK